MKIQNNFRAGRAGIALIMVLILAACSIIILAAVMNRSQTVAKLNQRNDDYVVACNAAEAAVEKVYARMAYDFQVNGLIGVTNDLVNNIFGTNIPNASENAFWSNFTFSDAQGHAGKTYVGYAYNYAGAMPSAYPGLLTQSAPVYRIISNVTNNLTGYHVVGTCQEDVLLALVPLVNYAIFYNGLLEFSQCATMVVNGPTYAFGGIYVGTSASLTFNGSVTTPLTLSAPLVDGLTSGWTAGTPSTWNTTFNSTPGYVTNQAAVALSVSLTNGHSMIDIPPTSESPTSPLGVSRLYNQANIILLVTNAPSGTGNPTVQMIIQSSQNGEVAGDDSNPTITNYANASPSSLSTNLPFLSLTNTFFDQREQKTNLVTQINMGAYATWASTNSLVQGKFPASSSQYPTIIYVADRRNVTASQLAVVRLANAAMLPSNNQMGLSVATMNPLYTWGNYNTQTNSSGTTTSLGTNNPTAKVPAALFSDALTVLSPSWLDSDSLTTYANNNSIFNASDTTINAAIIAGTMPSTGTTATTFSGGVHNLTRLLENWSALGANSTSDNLWLNTSILRLFNSMYATNQFRNPAGFSPTPVKPYYNPPTRNFYFDKNFLNPAKVPPGIPTILFPIRFAWTVPPPGTTTYTPTHN